jgi:hypothetical protein
LAATEDVVFDGNDKCSIGARHVKFCMEVDCEHTLVYLLNVVCKPRVTKLVVVCMSEVLSDSFNAGRIYI